MKRIGILCLGLGATVAGSSPQASLTTESRSDTGVTEGKHSVAPIAGYNPTYGVFLGGAYFHEIPARSLQIHGLFTFERVFLVGGRWEQDLGAGVTLELDPELSRGFDPYYGEGGTTRADGQVNLRGSKLTFQPTIRFRPGRHFSLGPFLDLRGRTETPGPDEARRFPDEATLAVGLFAEIDTRDNGDNPGDGGLFRVEWRVVPAGFSTRAGTPGFGQLEGDIRIYEELIPGTGIVAAVSLKGGVSVGRPTYPFRYRLGGAERLRGYHENRFRGLKYYIQQTELRVPLLKFLQGALFLGMGDATDGEFTQPKLIYGAGLRVALPPDWVQRARIDVGWGKDENGIFVDFGHAF